MELRQLTLEERPAYRRLMAEAFNGGRVPSDERLSEAEVAQFEANVGLALFDGTRAVAAAGIHALPVAWGDLTLSMGGVAGVACAADQRGRGHVARLLAESLVRMRDAGQVLSGLYPFAWAFYRKHGWEWVGEKREFTVPTAAIPSHPEGRSVQMYDGAEALDIVKPIHASYARHYRGMTTRENISPDWWDKALGAGGGRTTYVHVHRDSQTGQPDGYLTFRFPDGDGPGQVGEFFTLAPTAYQGLLSVLHYYGTQVETVRWSAPADDPLPLHVMHWDLKTAVSALFMGRVVDVGAALRALRPDGVSGRAFVRVSDPQCDWNDGTWAVTVEGGHVSATRTTAAPGVTMDIQAFSQAFWGQPSLSLLRAGGRIAVTDEAQFRLLAALLPPAVCFLPDFF